MEPQNITNQSNVPVLIEFKKSKFVLYMAWFTVAVYGLMTLLAIFSGGILSILSMVFSYQILLLASSLIVIFTTNKIAYDIAKIILILGYLVVITVLIIIMYSFDVFGN